MKVSTVTAVDPIPARVAIPELTANVETPVASANCAVDIVPVVNPAIISSGPMNTGPSNVTISSAVNAPATVAAPPTFTADVISTLLLISTNPVNVLRPEIKALLVTVINPTVAAAPTFRSLVIFADDPISRKPPAVRSVAIPTSPLISTRPSISNCELALGIALLMPTFLVV